MRFVDRGEHVLMGVPERWHLFAIDRDDPPGRGSS
jgi:hypothetical protein